MKFIITFQIADDFAEQISYHSVVCDEEEVNSVQQKMMSDYAPFIEVLSVTPYEGPDDSDYEDDEAIPF